jgi:hypothetical protein
MIHASPSNDHTVRIQMRKRPLLETPEQVTQSASAFYAQHFTNIMTYGISEMALTAHEGFVTATGKTLSTGDREPREVFPEAFHQIDYLKEQIESTRPARLEIALSRSVDNFLSYVSDILTQAIVTRPNLLKTKEQVTLEEVLQHVTLEDFVRWAAEKRVNELSFKGLTKIAEYIEKRLGLALHSSEADWKTLKQSVAVRNIVVHRRAIIDERFVWAMDDTSYQAGEKFSVPRELLADTMKCTMRVVRDFDKRVAEKFGLTLLDSRTQKWYQEMREPAESETPST